MAIQADLTRRDIAIVAIREQIDTREGSAAVNFFRRAMLAQGAYQVESASERVRMGLDRARASGQRIGDGLRRWVRNRWNSAGAWRRKGQACGRSPGS